MIARTSSVRFVTAALAFAVSLGGCLSVPDGATPMCKTTADCDHANGEVCEEGVCWGNPPMGPLAAVISPPSASHDLAPSEIPQLMIPDDGWMGDLALEPPVSLKGRLVQFCPLPMVCDSTTLGATVTVSRHSQFHGGPGFKTVVNVESGADSFAIPVPRTRAGDEMYTVTIVPAGGQEPGTNSPAELVPPLRMLVAVTASTTASAIELGGPDLPVLQGTLTDGSGLPLVGYRVAALGHWDPMAAPTEVSSVDFTDANGFYRVTLSAQLVETVELVARPPKGKTASTIHVANIDATKSSQRNVSEPANLGAPIKLTVPVTGLDRSGMVSPVRGAKVSVQCTLTSATNPNNSFTISDEQFTGEDGTVTLNLLNGSGVAGLYRLSIVPPANSSLGMVFAQPVTLGPGSSILAPIRLAPRIALRGKIVDSDGKPLNNVAVTARPSLRFLWTLESAPQAFVSKIQAATAVTPETGEFVVWVDANADQVWGHYDLLIEPPTTALAPTYIKTEVEIPYGTLDEVTLGDIALPDAAFVHGRITGPDGQPVENAEVKLYLLSTEQSLCGQVDHEPKSCPIPSQLQGRNTSDAKGTVRLVLPRL